MRSEVIKDKILLFNFIQKETRIFYYKYECTYTYTVRGKSLGTGYLGKYAFFRKMF